MRDIVAVKQWKTIDLNDVDHLRKDLYRRASADMVRLRLRPLAGGAATSPFAKPPVSFEPFSFTLAGVVVVVVAAGCGSGQEGKGQEKHARSRGHGQVLTNETDSGA